MTSETKFLAAALVCVIGLGGLGLWSTAVWQEIVEAVNGRLPAERRFQPLVWHPAKTLALTAEYRKLFPAGQLVRRFFALLAASVSLLLVIAGFLFSA